MLRTFHKCKIRALLLLLAVVCSRILVAQDETSLAPVTDVYAITNITIIPSPGMRIDKGVVIIRKGLIHAVGKDQSTPPDAIVIKGDSLFLYAGFIDGLSYAGVSKPKDEKNERPKDPANPPPDRAGITPQTDVRDYLTTGDHIMNYLRCTGFATAHVMPHGVFLPGKGAIILMAGNSVDDMVLLPEVSFCSALNWKSGAYPSTIMGALAKWRELYQQAILTKSYESQYAANASGLPRPVTDRILESFYPVIDKKIPVYFKASSVLEIQRVLSLQQEFKFPLILGAVKEGWDVAGKIKSSGAKVFLSLDLPEEPKDEKTETKKKEESSSDSTLSNPEKEALEQRKKEFTQKLESQAAVFNNAGIKFGFSTIDANKKNVHGNIRRMIAAGLSEDAALAALTTNAAELLGVSDRLGTVTKGKIANLIITDKPCFDEKVKVRYVFIDGKLIECDKSLESKEKDRKPDDLEGTWSMVADVPPGKTDLKVIFIKEDKHQYKGFISGGKLPDKTELTSITYNDKKLRFVYSVKIEDKVYEVIAEGWLEGKEFKGTMSVGEYGSFPMEGTKDPKINKGS